MNIAYITPSGIPSKEANTIQVMNMCEAFTRLGHTVDLICSTNTSLIANDTFDWYGIDSTFAIEQIPWKPFKGYQFAVLASLKAYFSGVDLVYGRTVAGCYFSSLFGCDVILEAHVPVDDRHPITDRMFASLIQSSNFLSLVVISNSLKTYYQSRYHFDGKLLVAPDSAVSQQGTPIENIRQSKDQQVGYVGHLYEGKGVELIINIAPKVSEQVFHIVGGTEDDIMYWKERTKTVDNIIFHGHVPPAEVENYIASFDVLIAPYQENVKGTRGETNLSRWMSPLKLFEYMSAGKPIICSDLPVLREILTDGKNALLRPPDSPEAWADALREIHSNQSLRNEIANNAKREFEAKYSYLSRAERILENISTG